jgi:transposase InsO family protein
MDRKKILKRYVTPGDPLAFSSRNALSRKFKISGAKVDEDILSYNYSYPLHRATKRIKYNPYINIRFPRQQIQCDLLDVSRLARFNSGYRNLLVAIDCFSRFVWVKPLKTKSASEVADVFQELIDDWQPELPKQITVDQGTEFKNVKVTNLFKKYGIKMFHPTSEGKAVYVERVNQTLQSLIYRYLSEKQTRSYIDVLQDLVETYNSRPHRSLNNLAPSQAVKDENVFYFRRVEQNRIAPIITRNLRSTKSSRNKFKVGDIVRIRKWKSIFDRGYKQTFSNEYYKINRVLDNLPSVTYELQNLNDEEIVVGGFYANELQLIKGGEYKIEKILKTEKDRNGKPVRYFVKWLGFDNRHNSWVNVQDMIV